MAKTDLKYLKEDGAAVYQAVTYFKGALKKRFIEDVERGEKPADLLRQMAKVFYEQKEVKARHGY